MNCEYVTDYYQVPACIGRRVEVDGQPGIIEAANSLTWPGAIALSTMSLSIAFVAHTFIKHF